MRVQMKSSVSSLAKLGSFGATSACRRELSYKHDNATLPIFNDLELLLSQSSPPSFSHYTQACRGRR